MEKQAAKSEERLTEVQLNTKLGIDFPEGGSETISTEPELLKRSDVGGKLPRVLVIVAVDEAFNLRRQ